MLALKIGICFSVIMSQFIDAFFCLEENLVLNYWKIKTVVQNI